MSCVRGHPGQALNELSEQFEGADEIPTRGSGRHSAVLHVPLLRPLSIHAHLVPHVRSPFAQLFPENVRS